MAAYQDPLTSGANAMTPAQLVASNTTGVGPGSLDPTISSANLTPQTPITPTQPTQSPPPSIAGLDSSVSTTATTLGPNEQSASDLTKQIEALNASLSGESSYQTQQNQAAGVDTIQKAIGDNTAAIKQLQNEANIIPQQIQQDALGRGQTAAGVAPIQTGQLRENSIKALTLSSISDALNNNLVAAQTKANTAVQAMYGQQEADLKAKTANLQLILNDPATTLEEKNRANAQQQVLAAQSAQIEQNKVNSAAIIKTAQDAGTAASNFKPTTVNGVYYGTLSAALSGIANAKTPVDAVTIQNATGLVPTQAGRYKDVAATITDAFGNQSQVIRIFDTTTGKFVSGGNGQTAASLNGNTGNGVVGGTGGIGNTGSAPTTGTGNGLSVGQYGLLASTNFSPTNTIDNLAQKYIDQYIKNGTVPTASTLGRNMKPAAVAQVDARARDLYYQATGTPLPNPEVIKGYQAIVNANNTFANNLAVQESTVNANFGLSLSNLKASDLNTNGNNAINTFLDNVKQFWLGNPQAAQYALQNSTVSNEIGSLLAVRNASGTTVYDKMTSAGLVSKGASFDQQKAMLQTLLTEANNAKSSLAQANAPLYKQIDPLMQDPNNPLRQTALNSQFVNNALTSQGLHYDALIAEMTPAAPAGTQPALDAKTGKTVFATPQDIQNGLAIPL